MHFPCILITLLALIAHAHCGTLREYSRDWLIPKPEPQVGSKRITAKSVFITPNFPQNVRCTPGYQQDSSGRCVKLVHVNQGAQLDFLLQRLNAMYGAPVVSHSEKQPLQVDVEIPVEPTDPDLLEDTDELLNGEEMYSQHLPVFGEILDVNLFSQSEKNETKEEDEKKESALSGAGETHVNNTGVVQIDNKTSILNDSHLESQNITSTTKIPDEFPVYLEEEPYVSLTVIHSSDEDEYTNATKANTGENSVGMDNSTEKIPDRLISILDETNVEYEVKNNTSKIIKKETASHDNSTEKIPDRLISIMDVTNVEFEVKNNASKIIKNETASDDNSTQSCSSDPDHGFHSNHTFIVSPQEEKNSSETPLNEDIKSENDRFVFTSTSSTDLVNEENSILENSFEIKFPDGISDESTNKMKSNSSELEGGVTSIYSADYDSSTKESVTMLPTIPETTTVLPNLVTVSELEVVTELVDTFETHKFVDIYHGSGDDNFGSGVDLEVDKDYFNRKPSASVEVHVNKSGGHVSEVGSEESVYGNVEESDNVNSESNLGSEGVNLYEVNSEQDPEISAGVNLGDEEDLEHSSINKMNNRTDQDEVYSVSQTAINDANTNAKLPFKIDLGYIDYSKPNLENSSENTDDLDDLKLENTTPQVFIENDQKIPEQSENQENSKPNQQKVQVVYPQPIFQMSFVHKPQSESIIEPIANSKLKDTIDFKPSPLQVHNLNPQLQMPSFIDPIVEKVQDNSQKYGGFPYPPLPPLPETQPPRPYNQPPQEQNPQINKNHNGQNSFVRFPVDSVHTQSQPYAHRDKQSEEVNTVRFPQDDGRYNDKYSRWGGQHNSNWRFENNRNQRPEQRFWQGRHETQNPQATSRRNYWADNWPNRRRQQPTYNY